MSSNSPAIRSSYRESTLAPHHALPPTASRPDDLHEWLSFDLDDETYHVRPHVPHQPLDVHLRPRVPRHRLTGPAPELEHGCCSYGAHFTDKADRKRVAERVAEQLERRRVAVQGRGRRELGGPIHKNDDGEWVTRIVDDACIFLNRPGFPAGAGCALHQAAVRRGERFLDWKPEVCWQLPLRLDHHVDDNDHITYILREWKRRDWGEGGAEFHWWCTDDRRGLRRRTSPSTRRCATRSSSWSARCPTSTLVEQLRDRPADAALLPHPALKKRRLSTPTGATDACSFTLPKSSQQAADRGGDDLPRLRASTSSSRPSTPAST